MYYHNHYVLYMYLYMYKFNLISGRSCGRGHHIFVFIEFIFVSIFVFFGVIWKVLGVFFLLVLLLVSFFGRGNRPA